MVARFFIHFSPLGGGGQGSLVVNFCYLAEQRR